MKHVSTRKAIVAQYGTQNILSVSYADLQTLLKFENATAYTSGVYGWNADIYDIGGVAICTGYRPFGRNVNRDTIRKYERLARDTVARFEFPFNREDLRDELHTLALSFIAEATGE